MHQLISISANQLIDKKFFIILKSLQRRAAIAVASCKLPIKKGGLAQLARASALHAEGHRFDSDILHFFS